MKVDCCDICYWESKHTAPKLTLSAWNISSAHGAMKFSLKVCEAHKAWLKERQGKTIEQLQAELKTMQQEHYGFLPKVPVLVEATS